MVSVTKYQLSMCLILNVFLIFGQQAGGETPLYLMDQSHIPYMLQGTLLLSQIIPFILVIGWEERMQTGQGLNYFVRHKSRLQAMFQSYLHSTIVVSVATVVVILIQVALTKHQAIDYRWLGVILFYVTWHMVQRLFESYVNSVGSLVMIVIVLILGSFIKIPIFKPILFLFGQFSGLNSVKSIVMLIIFMLLWLILGYIYRKKQVI